MLQYTVVWGKWYHRSGPRDCCLLLGVPPERKAIQLLLLASCTSADHFAFSIDIDIDIDGIDMNCCFILTRGVEFDAPFGLVMRRCWWMMDEGRNHRILFTVHFIRYAFYAEPPTRLFRRSLIHGPLFSVQARLGVLHLWMKYSTTPHGGLLYFSSPMNGRWRPKIQIARPKKAKSQK